MRLLSIFGILILTIIGFWTCQYAMEDPMTEGVPSQPIIDALIPEDSFFTFLAEEGFEYKMASGTEIKIPKGALMNSSREVVNGEVQLKFSEYRDALDLWAAGISMKTSTGLNQTAGAFKIEIAQGDKILSLDPTKSVEIKQACYEKEDDYALFFSDNQGSTWDSLYTLEPYINEEHVRIEREIKKRKPRIKFPLEEDHFAFSYKGILDVIYNNDLTNVSHPTTKKKMEKYGLRWSNINVEAFVEKEGKQEFAALMVWRNVSKKPFPAWTKNAKGSLEKIKNDRYRLVIEDPNQVEKFSTQVEPILPLKELFSSGPGYWHKDYDLRIKEVKKSYTALSQLASAYRVFSFSNLGIYTWQKNADEEAPVSLLARFKFDNESLPSNHKGLFYLSGDHKAIQYFPRSQWNTFMLFADPDAKLFSIDSNQQLWLYPSAKLRAIDFAQLQKMNNPSFVFNMEKVLEEVQSLDALREVFTAMP